MAPIVVRAALAAILALLVATLLACMTIPRVSLSRQMPLSEAPVVLSMEGPDGPVPWHRRAEVSGRLGEVGETPLLDYYLAAMERLIDAPLVIGNRVALLVDGPATYAAIFAAIREARESVLVESYIFDDTGHDGVRLGRLLLDKAAEGIPVHVIYDSVGSWSTPQAAIDALRAGGVQVCEFNPVDARSLLFVGRLNNRNHRKVVVVDNRTGFAGGINFSKVYRDVPYGRRGGSSGRPPDPAVALERGWRDTHLEVEGPAAARLAELFAETWREQDCGATPPQAAGPPPKAGETVVQVIPSSPADATRNQTYVSVLGAVEFATRSIDVTMAYFVPDPQLEDALVDAARRGVRVRMVLPAFSDFSSVFHAGRARYERLLEAGIEIYEHEQAFLHAKSVVVDRVWSTVGSTNWDWRSFVYNDEISIVVIDEGFAGAMERLFEADRAASKPVTAAEWARRPWTMRAQERFATLLSRLL